MLVLSRHADESLIVYSEEPLYRIDGTDLVEIDSNIVFTVVEIRGDKARIGIDADKVFTVHRQEVYDRIQREVPPLNHGDAFDTE